MRKLSQAVVYLSLLTPVLSHSAGIQIGRTRIIYHAEKKEIALPLVNKDKALPWLIQSWTDTGDEKTRGPFIVTPPLFRLDAQKEQSLRVAWNGSALPEDRESLFYMNIRTIPATAKDDSDKNMLRLNYKTRLKLFWRPSGLAGTPGETCKNLRFSRDSNAVTVINNGAFYSVFDSLLLDNTVLPKADMVAPFSRVSVPLPGNTAGSQISWRCITDYGNASEKYTSTLIQE
ncbi:fimbrial biogenesis chaperone [unidentified bacterial endosymbiont]|jgi:fimbrial chaperone protein|uniref:fimbrial biogenesis chaperone n=1 Tax=unidentified bacterial endosymbiont TaxID=2355 RepID=UPI00209E555D|nr:molecular chaperone [unidentified bacterial endosymbiont]